MYDLAPCRGWRRGGGGSASRHAADSSRRGRSGRGVEGVAAPSALALSLVLRLRDVVFGSALVLWPVLEYRARRIGLEEKI